MSHTRKPSFRQTMVGFLRAIFLYPLEAYAAAKRATSFGERAVSYLISGMLLGFVLLLLSAPFILALVIFTPINLTVLWLQIGAALVLVCFLAFLPQIARESPRKGLLLVLIACLFSLTLYLYTSTNIPRTLAQTPILLAYGFLYAWKVRELFQADQQNHTRLFVLSLASILAITCFGLAGWYLLQQTFGVYLNQSELVPLIFLLALYPFFPRLDRTTTTSRRAP